MGKFWGATPMDRRSVDLILIFSILVDRRSYHPIKPIFSNHSFIQQSFPLRTLYWHLGYVTSYPISIPYHKLSHQKKTKFSLPSRYQNKNKDNTYTILSSGQISGTLIFNLLLPRMFERLTPISPSSLRRLNRGSCRTPNLSYPLISNWLRLFIHVHISIRTST